ncbi:MAG: hypothetical protein E6R03_14200 [Hyphomicrobiaceae bacterium]|nr:MAG: hypothetical protein E6R03_14200 [Hyphomicrobiaceae bacterium]
MESLLDNSKIVRHNNGATAGTTTITPSAGIDMQGFNAVTFLVLLGTITSTGVPSIKVQQSDDDGVADAYSDLEGTAYATDDTSSNKMMAVSVIRPTKRYLRLILTRATANVVLDAILAILTNGQSLPITQTALGNEKHVSPAEGTA